VATRLVHPLPPPLAADLVEGFRGLAVSLVSDCLERLRGTSALRPLHASGARLAGCALTVKTRPGDNLFVHKALDLARPGDVLVVDAGGDGTNAVVGDLLAEYAATRGVAGFVVDGAIRDLAGFREFPVWARGVSHRGPWKEGPGEIGAPVSVGGMVVLPGDLVLADEDGVVAVRRDEAADVLARARARAADEDVQRRAIAEGRWDRSWVDAALAKKGWL
jgi:regulator of RNase E activity RraA